METIKIPFTPEIRAHVAAAKYASSVKDIRYYLNGVCFQVNKAAQVRIVATDGHRLFAGFVDFDKETAERFEFGGAEFCTDFVIKIGDIPALLNASKNQPGDLTLIFKSYEDEPAPRDPEWQIVTASGAPVAGGVCHNYSRYPDVDRVISKGSAATSEALPINAGFLKDVAPMAKELTGYYFRNSKSFRSMPYIQIGLIGEQFQIVFTGITNALYIIMPARATGLRSDIKESAGIIQSFKREA